MDYAFSEAEFAFLRGEVPVGAVIIEANSGLLLAHSGNRMKEWSDPTAHAEMIVIRSASARVRISRLVSCDLYVTLEPCSMCAAAISFARIRRLYFGAYDQKYGAVEHGSCFFSSVTCHHRPDIYGGLQECRSLNLLETFFRRRRTRK